MIFQTTETVRFSQVDAAGIVFYPRFLDMVNNLVEDWFAQALNYPFQNMHPHFGVPTVDLQAQFKKPARLGEVLTKKLWVATLKQSSVQLHISFENAQAETVLNAQVVLVYVQFDAHTHQAQSTPFTDALRAQILAYEH